MKALNLMKALRDVPDELIDECFDEPAPHVGIQTQPADLFAEHEAKPDAKTVQPPSKPAESPHLLKYAAVAASLLFAVGFGALILHGSMWNQPVQHQPEDMEIITAPDTTSGITATSPLRTTTEPVFTDVLDTEPVYTELELHNNELPVMNEDETGEMIRAGQKRYAENGFRPVLIDTEKYIGEYFSEDSEGDLNSLEAKSYLYHMMLNSMDYYKTAEGEMIIQPNGSYAATSSTTIIEFQLDNVNQCSYEKRTYVNSSLHDKELYFADLREYELDIENNTFFLHHYAGETDILFSDNERVFCQPDGTTLAYNRPSNAFGSAMFHSSLTPQYYAGMMLADFDRWYVACTATMLGRTCAVIEAEMQNDVYRMYTDVQTGILFRLEPLTEAHDFILCFEVNRLRIDNEIAVKQFDPEGRECLNPEEADWIPTDPSYNKPQYQVNKYGQTYGHVAAKDIEDYPDLVACIGDNGKEGYVYSKEFLEITAKTPEEAAKIAEEQHNGTYIPRILTVYKSDGKTPIDTFTEKP